MRTFFCSNSFKGAMSDYKGVVQCEGLEDGECLHDIMDARSSELLFHNGDENALQTRWFHVVWQTEVDFSSTSELLYPNRKKKLQLIRARPNFYMISDNPNVNRGIVDCSRYTRQVALKDEYHNQRMDMVVYTLL